MFSPWFVTLITTLGTTAPDASVTVPRIVPKMVCPSPGVARHDATTIMLNVMTKGLNFMEDPLPEDRPSNPVTNEPVTGRKIAQSICHRGNDSQPEKAKKTGWRKPGRKTGSSSLFLDVNWASVMGFARRALPW